MRRSWHAIPIPRLVLLNESTPGIGMGSGWNQDGTGMESGMDRDGIGTGSGMDRDGVGMGSGWGREWDPSAASREPDQLERQVGKWVSKWAGGG